MRERKINPGTLGIFLSYIFLSKAGNRALAQVAKAMKFNQNQNTRRWYTTKLGRQDSSECLRVACSDDGCYD
ncbi:MAG: hypothetical protein JNJ50_12185 [Acidobacteria bacterium]|nr:hypothetical protein [Acidobacteriota bacterium]